MGPVRYVVVGLILTLPSVGVHKETACGISHASLVQTRR